MELDSPQQKRSFRLFTTFGGGAAASLFCFFLGGCFLLLESYFLLMSFFFLFAAFFVFTLDGPGASSSGFFLYVRISMLTPN